MEITILGKISVNKNLFNLLDKMLLKSQRLHIAVGNMYVFTQPLRHEWDN